MNKVIPYRGITKWFCSTHAPKVSQAVHGQQFYMLPFQIFLVALERNFSTKIAVLWHFNLIVHRTPVLTILLLHHFVCRCVVSPANHWRQSTSTGLFHFHQNWQSQSSCIWRKCRSSVRWNICPWYGDMGTKVYRAKYNVILVMTDICSSCCIWCSKFILFVAQPWNAHHALMWNHFLQDRPQFDDPSLMRFIYRTSHACKCSHLPHCWFTKYLEYHQSPLWGVHSVLAITLWTLSQMLW